ncbi:hypothetical protein SAMD00019534_116470 [Acytostelium subglobosum LB1]|uniref:hypothetical protein n=1 Tax=Acytostelium subglobosum LB1 TaxID=1410327 RepID=UPI000645032E|nr:hypothetical protein SAMD00019534_116470 [Acytostelium subglobosum LB1]GAM28471.1 hypothetical protein SAMD00019534_116470 [Acytostelium subglobosum LB1]|eukprot:XP_012748510.1 hypothetical protein SAMD00019534_116470 [Acytostelium subglobosum LB1]
MFGSLQYIMWTDYYQAPVPLTILYTGNAYDDLNQPMTYSLNFTCPPPPILYVNSYSGPLVRNRVVPMMLYPPGFTDGFQTVVKVSDQFLPIYGEYLCSALGYTCLMYTLRADPENTGTLVQLYIYPDIALVEFDKYRLPINITVTNTARKAWIIFPALVTQTTQLTQGVVAFNYNMDIGLVPRKFNPNFAAVITHTPGATYFLNPNASAPSAMACFKVVKPVTNLEDGTVRTLAISVITTVKMMLLEVTNNPVSIYNYNLLTTDPITKPATVSNVIGLNNGQKFTSTFILPSYVRCSFTNAPTGLWFGSELTYPFGVTNIVSGGNTTLSFTFSASNFMPSNLLQMDCAYGTVTITTPIASNRTDIKRPSVEAFELVPLKDNLFILRATFVDDMSGFARLHIYFSTGEIYDVDYRDLYSGTNLNGNYEKLITLNYATNETPKFYMFLTDYSTNMGPNDLGYSISGMVQGFKTGNYIIGPEDFTLFYFDKYEMDVSNQTMMNKLYIRSPKLRNRWQVTMTYGAVEENPLYQNKGVYDASRDLYVITFNVPARTMTKQMQYYITLKPAKTVNSPSNYSPDRSFYLPNLVGSIIINSDQLIKQFPYSSVVNIKSTYGDELPPMITYVMAVPSNTPVMTVAGNMEIGWNLTIGDHFNGFHHGIIRVISDVDGFERTILVNSSNRIEGNETIGVYQVLFNVTSDFKTQTFTFRDIDLYDKSMNLATYRSFERQFKTLSPLAYIVDYIDSVLQLNIKLTTASNDVTPPVLETLDVLTPIVDVGSTERWVKIQFTVRDAGGMSPRHNPVVYLTGYLFETFKMVAEIYGQNADPNVYTYQAIGELPYGFGFTSAGQNIDSPEVYISVYGLVDKSQNINGYSTSMLPNNGLVTSTMGIKFTHISPIFEGYMLDPNGAPIITVYGKNFAKDVMMADTANPTIFNKTFGSVVVAVFNFTTPTNEPTTMVVLLKNFDGTYYSNPIGISYFPPVVVVIPTVNCSGTPQCSNHGECSPTFGCQCYDGYYGDDCSSKAVPNVPVINPDYPTTVYTFNSSGMTIVGEIEIVRVRVLDQLGAELVSFPINQWNVSSPSSTGYAYDYVSNFGPNNGATIKVGVRWFTKDENITFAGDVLPMKNNTIKYTITLSNYVFPSQLDSMQVVMRATINTTDPNSCSAEQFGYTEGNKDNLFWMRVKVQSYSVYGHFIQKAMVDGRSFTRQAVMDPDFQLLLDIDDASTVDGAVCSKRKDGGGSGSSKLSTLAIVGIVVLCVVIVAAIVVAVVMRMRAVRRRQSEVHRIQMKLNRLSEQQPQQQ